MTFRNDIEGEGGAAAFARWLHLAATPVFALMALLTALSGAPDVLCPPAGSSPFSGMAVMYALMSAFHAGPWLRLMFRT